MRPSVGQADLLLSPTSTGRHPAADPSDWTGTWVCVGFAEQLTEVGAVLPATIGYHAAHVRRIEGGLVAAINARPFGGCASIPVHCGSTRNVRCPQLACAFSEDGGVLDSQTDPSGAARVGFLGDGRRTATALPLAQWSSLLFVNDTMTRPPALPSTETPPLAHSKVVATGRQLVGGNWLISPQRAASSFISALTDSDGAAIEVSTVAPNVALVRSETVTFVAVSRPAGHTRSVIVWAVFGATDADPVIDPLWRLDMVP